MIINPHMLPKVRSDALRNSVTGFPHCTLRIASFFGLSCADPSTNVMCHTGALGKGWGTKVSDLNMAGGCFVCHDIIDGRRKALLDKAMTDYPAAFLEQIHRANQETLARWLGEGLIVVPDGELV